LEDTHLKADTLERAVAARTSSNALCRFDTILIQVLAPDALDFMVGIILLRPIKRCETKHVIGGDGRTKDPEKGIWNPQIFPPISIAFGSIIITINEKLCFFSAHKNNKTPNVKRECVVYSITERPWDVLHSLFDVRHDRTTMTTMCITRVDILVSARPFNSS